MQRIHNAQIFLLFLEFFGHGNYEKLCSTLSRSQKQVQKYLKKVNKFNFKWIGILCI